jgi:aminoglycoside phosphotransferase (APT) family kinase protein
MTETLFGDVAPAHRFDEAALAAYLNRHIDDFGADMKVLQIRGGASNPTFLLETSDCARSHRDNCWRVRTRWTANIAS